MADCALAAIAADKVVGVERDPSRRFLHIPRRINLDRRPRAGVILPNIDHLVVKQNSDMLGILLRAVAQHDFEDLAERQDGHAVLLVGNDGEVDAGEALARADAPPAYVGEAGDAAGADVVEEAGAAEDARGGHAVLRRAQALVWPVPGFEDGGVDAALCEEDSEE